MREIFLGIFRGKTDFWGNFWVLWACTGGNTLDIRASRSVVDNAPPPHNASIKKDCYFVARRLT